MGYGGHIRSIHGLESVHADVARLDASIGVFLVRFGSLRGVWVAKNDTNSYQIVNSRDHILARGGHWPPKGADRSLWMWLGYS